MYCSSVVLIFTVVHVFTHCVVITCLPLTAPDNGFIACELGKDGAINPGDTCIFTCDHGFDISDSTMALCQSDGSWSWSGTDAMCNIRGICSVLSVLVHVIQSNSCLYVGVYEIKQLPHIILYQCVSYIKYIV